MTTTALADFDALWDYGAPADTEPRFRELLPLAHQSGDHGYLVELLTQIARIQGLQRRFDDAHRTLDEAEQLLDDAARPRVRYLLERGRVFRSSGNPEPARQLFERAWELGLEAGAEFYAVDAAHMLAITASSDDPLVWHQRAIEVAERSTDARTRGWLASLYNNLGWSYHDLGRFDDALQCFRHALAERERRDDPRETRIAHWAVARALRSLGRDDEALAIQQANLARAAARNDPDGYIHEELGECLLALGRLDEARPHFARAHELLSADAWLAESEPERVRRLQEFANA